MWSSYFVDYLSQLIPNLSAATQHMPEFQSTSLIADAGFRKAHLCWYFCSEYIILKFLLVGDEEKTNKHSAVKKKCRTLSFFNCENLLCAKYKSLIFSNFTNEYMERKHKNVITIGRLPFESHSPFKIYRTILCFKKLWEIEDESLSITNLSRH